MSAVATWYAIAGPNGDLTWRVQSPARAIGAKAVLIPEATGFKSLFYPNVDSEFPWTLSGQVDGGDTVRVTSETQWKDVTAKHKTLAEPRCAYLAQEGDAAVFTRPLAWEAAHMIEMRRQGIRIAAEVDDNYLSDQSLNVFMRKAGWGENDRDNHSRSVAVGDALIVSTAHLRDVYYRGLRAEFGKKHLPDIFVCRNHIDERYMPERIPPRADGRLRVGYMGSDSHVWDVDIVYDALMHAYQQGHEIVFVGIHPALLNPKYRKSRKDWSKIPYTHIPWRNEGYRGTALPLDIGLAPLRVDAHTMGKSDIKWLEYALSGAACVAHNCLVYNRTARHGETALLASSPAEYVASVDRLIRDPSLRERLVAATLEYVNEERLLSKNTREWEEAVLGV